MDFRTFWPRLPGSQQPKPPSAEDLISQEDDETRRIIAHYLHLADQFLATGTAEDQEDDQTTAA